MVNLFHRIFLLISAYSLLVTVHGQEDWTLRQDKDGIKVFSRSTDRTNFDEFRATMELNQSIHSFLAVIMDIQNLDKWSYHVKNPRLLQQKEDSLQIYYTEVSMPFPFSDRDAVFMNSFTWKSDSSLLLIDIEVHPNYLKENENFVRIPFGKGLWRVKVTGQNQLNVMFQLQIDPGGNVPAWLANIFVTTTPTYTLKKLREIIAEDKYQNQRFEWLD